MASRSENGSQRYSYVEKGHKEPAMDTIGCITVSPYEKPTAHDIISKQQFDQESSYNYYGFSQKESSKVHEYNSDANVETGNLVTGMKSLELEIEKHVYKYKYKYVEENILAANKESSVPNDQWRADKGKEIAYGGPAVEEEAYLPYVVTQGQQDDEEFEGYGDYGDDKDYGSYGDYGDDDDYEEYED